MNAGGHQQYTASVYGLIKDGDYVEAVRILDVSCGLIYVFYHHVELLFCPRANRLCEGASLFLSRFLGRKREREK